jgi:hypothetical protein
MNNTTVANLATIGGVTLMLGIAGFSLPISLAILGVTTAGCAYLTYKEGK